MLRPFPPLFLALLAAAPLSATVDLEPEKLLPPAPSWHGASEALVVGAAHPWVTPAERTGLTDSPSYDETLAWLERLAAASPRIELQRFGTTAQGRPLYAVLAASPAAPVGLAALAANGKPTVLAQAGIHAGEIDGKDAGLMFLRDLAFGDRAALLERANFVLIPVFNADGHERASPFNRPNQRGPQRMGWRTTAQNLNLNRDYMKADAPEMQAMLDLLNTLDPALVLDLHVTDGIDYQYDITYGFHGWDQDFAWSPRIAAWLRDTYRPAVDAALAAAGHIPGPLVFAANNRDVTQGIGRGPADPRFSNAYGDLRRLPTILVENHSLKPFRQRVLGTHVLLEASLRAAGEHAAALRAAITADRAERTPTVAMNFDRTVPAGTTPFAGIAHEEYDSPVSGRREVRWLGTSNNYDAIPLSLTQPVLTVARPKAYWVPVTHPAVIERLRRHGIRVEEVLAERTLALEFYRLVDPRPAAAPFEGRHVVKLGGVRPETRAETFPVGSVRVPTDQPLGDLAIALLEPQGNDSFFAWGFFPEILQRTEYMEGYVVAPLAEKMLAADPALKAEFETKLAAEAKFRADPAARLRWFYERSPFYDQRHLLYPVGIER